MAKRNVIWTRTADIQFVGILEYWVKRNKSNSYSLKLVRLVSERTNQIADNPLLYKATDFKDTRVASLGNFSMYYKITDTEIIPKYALGCRQCIFDQENQSFSVRRSPLKK